jgi:4-hydroxy-tetrahydrodipicolinate synthase
LALTYHPFKMVFNPEGVFTALVTPFTPDGASVDWEAYHALCRTQAAAGVNLVPVGTTGESPTLSSDEKSRLITDAIAIAKEAGVQVIAGTGSNNTAETILKTKAARAAGADAALIVSPYYNKPTQKGLIEHIKAIAAAVPDFPLVLYDVPGRAVVTLAPGTIATLRKEVKEVAAIKAASGSLDQVNEIAKLCDIPILSGDDGLTLPMMSVGAKGVISVASNLFPKDMKDMVDAALKGDFATARETHFKLFPFFKNLFIEVNPVPAKYCLAKMGVIPSAAVRLPLVPLEPENAAKLDALLAPVTSSGAGAK